MNRSRSRWGVFVVALAVSAWSAGCGSQPAVEATQEKPLPSLATPNFALSELLSQARAELAKHFEELAAQVQIQEKAHRDGTLAFGLLPRLRLPLILPIWAEASYSAKAQMSLPPYVAEDSKDNHLALHLARFGDIEAARRIAEPDDKRLLQTIADLACERNYPAEWTRLAALM